LIVGEAIPRQPRRVGEKFVITFLLLVFFGFVLYKMVFLPTSVSFESYPKKIFVYSSSPVTVKIIALNRLGFGIPFKRLNGKFVVREGTEKIEVVGEKRNEFIFRTKGSSGRLVILYYTSVVPFPVEIILNIEDATVADKDSHGVFFGTTFCHRENREYRGEIAHLFGVNL
jgi:hypothetical protein